MEKVRAFWALEIGEAARRRACAIAEALRTMAGAEDVRWVSPETLHVTLRFLGSTDPERARELAGAVARETREAAPFPLSLGAVSSFPSRRPRVVALGLRPEAPLAALAAAVERGVVAAGFPPESRAFRPHLTLGRARRDRRVRLDAEILRRVTASVTEPDDAWEVMETVLFRSDLSPRGARYTPLERVPLGTSGGPLHP